MPLVPISHNDETEPYNQSNETQDLEPICDNDVLDLNCQEPLAIRQSSREKRRPKCLSGFICQVHLTTHKETSSKNNNVDYTPGTYPFISPNYFSSDYLNFIANITMVREPITYFEAKNNSVWIKAMKDEIKTQNKMKHGIYVNCLEEKKPTGCR